MTTLFPPDPPCAVVLSSLPRREGQPAPILCIGNPHAMTAARHSSTAIIGARFFIQRLFAALKQRDDVQRVFLLLPVCLYALFVPSRGRRALMRPWHRSRMMPAHFAD